MICFKNKRVYYSLMFIALFVIEIIIALYVRDSFIRPYGGDVLVTVLLCCFLRIFIPNRCKLLPLFVFLFAAFVEVLQAINIVALLGLQNIRFLRILIGTTFSVADIICYAVGCLIFFLIDYLLHRK